VLIRLDLAAHLRADGLTVFEAATADEALIILKSMEPVGLVIPDIRMPGGADGLDLLSWLRREQPGVEVILISGYIPTERMTAIRRAFYGPDAILGYGSVSSERSNR